MENNFKKVFSRILGSKIEGIPNATLHSKSIDQNVCKELVLGGNQVESLLVEHQEGLSENGALGGRVGKGDVRQGRFGEA